MKFNVSIKYDEKIEDYKAEVSLLLFGVEKKLTYQKDGNEITINDDIDNLIVSWEDFSDEGQDLIYEFLESMDTSVIAMLRAMDAEWC